MYFNRPGPPGSSAVPTVRFTNTAPFSLCTKIQVAQVYRARPVVQCSPKSTWTSARPSVPVSSSGTGLAQAYRAYPLQWCTNTGCTKALRWISYGSNFSNIWCIPYWKMGDEAVYGLVAGDGGASEGQHRRHHRRHHRRRWIVKIRMVH